MLLHILFLSVLLLIYNYINWHCYYVIYCVFFLYFHKPHLKFNSMTCNSRSKADTHVTTLLRILDFLECYFYVPIYFYTTLRAFLWPELPGFDAWKLQKTLVWLVRKLRHASHLTRGIIPTCVNEIKSC